MSFDLLKEKAALRGFSKILGSPESQFYLLSDKTDGRCGRRVYINAAISETFIQHVSADDFDLVLFRLEQLRSTAGGLTSYSNINNAFEYFSTIDRFQVGYKIFQNTGSAKSKPGVYITSLEALTIEDGRPGLYQVKSDDGKDWEAKESKKLTHAYAAVNGLTRNLKMAADTIIPPMLETAYNGKEYKGSVKDGYNLIYNPPTLYYKNKVWKTPQDKLKGKDFTAKLLSEQLLDSQRRGQEVNWVVHGDGAKVFLDAMTRISSNKLDKHRVLFLAPKADMVKILPLVRQSQMKLHSSVMTFQADDWNREGGKNRISQDVAKEVAKFGGAFQGKADAMANEAAINRDKLMVLGRKSFKAGGWAASALIHPAIPAVGAGLNMAFGMPAMARGVESIRNFSANNIAAPDLNPHLHPFKSTPEMNAFVASQTGGKMKSFAAVVRAKLKGRK